MICHNIYILDCGALQFRFLLHCTIQYHILHSNKSRRYIFLRNTSPVLSRLEYRAVPRPALCAGLAL